MIGRILAPRRITEHSVLTNVRSQFAQAILIFLIIGNSALILSDLLSISNDQPAISASLLVSLLTMAYYLVSLIGLAAGRFVTLGINVLTIYLAVLTFSVAGGAGGSDITLFAFLSIAIVAAALLSLRWVYWLVMGLIVLRLALHVDSVLGISSGGSINSENLSLLLGIAIIGMIPLLFGALISRFISVLGSTAREAQRSADLLEATARIGQDISQILDQKDILKSAADLLRDNFGYYYVQIFLVEDDRRGAQLIAATGTEGQKRLAEAYRVTMSSTDIGRVIRTGEAVLAADITDMQRAGAMANTRSRLLLPITDGTIVLGVLDVHSTRARAFTTIEVRALEVLTNQIANAVRNARLFEAQSLSVDENRALLETAEENLREIQRLNRQLTRQIWEDFLKRSEMQDGFGLAGNQVLPSVEWSESMLEASKRRRPVTEIRDGAQIISVPVELRGEILGAIEVEVPEGSSAEDMADILQTIAQRFAINLDNARLFEETQISTAQDQRIAELVSQYQSANSIDELLQVTVSSLRDLMGSEGASIRLGVLGEDVPGPVKANGMANHGGQN